MPKSANAIFLRWLVALPLLVFGQISHVKADECDRIHEEEGRASYKEGLERLAKFFDTSITCERGKSELASDKKSRDRRKQVEASCGARVVYKCNSDCMTVNIRIKEREVEETCAFESLKNKSKTANDESCMAVRLYTKTGKNPYETENDNANLRRHLQGCNENTDRSFCRSTRDLIARYNSKEVGARLTCDGNAEERRARESREWDQKREREKEYHDACGKVGAYAAMEMGEAEIIAQIATCNRHPDKEYCEATKSALEASWIKNKDSLAARLTCDSKAEERVARQQRERDQERDGEQKYSEACVKLGAYAQKPEPRPNWNVQALLAECGRHPDEQACETARGIILASGKEFLALRLKCLGAILNTSKPQGE